MGAGQVGGVIQELAGANLSYLRHRTEGVEPTRSCTLLPRLYEGIQSVELALVRGAVVFNIVTGETSQDGSWEDPHPAPALILSFVFTDFLVELPLDPSSGA